jgi:hypothetical protein
MECWSIGRLTPQPNVQSTLDTYLGNVEQNDCRKMYLTKAPLSKIRNPNIEIRNKLKD